METNPMVERAENEEMQHPLLWPMVIAASLALTGAFVWFHWSSFALLYKTWTTQDDYQHGFAVPLFSLWLLWVRRDMIVPFAGRGSYWGLALLGVWAVLRWAAVYFNIGTLPEFSMLPFLAGTALFVGGWQALLWSWPSITFLVFMFPLPIAIQVLLSSQLQTVATQLSVYVIQTLGIPAVAMGHVIHLTEEHRLDVAQACSGLRMMMFFFALCVGVAFLMKKPMWERIFVVASAIPIAVASNMVRIVMTAVLSEVAWNFPSAFDPDQAMEFIHKWVGITLMMPVGLLLLWAETALLAKLLIAPVSDRPLILGRLSSEGKSQKEGMPVVPRRRRR
jgi:exosortase